MQGQLGPEVSYDIKYDAGKLILSIKDDGKDASVSLGSEIKLVDILKEIAAHTDNKWDDALVEYLAKLLPLV